MSQQISARTCVRCGWDFEVGDEVVPVLHVVRKGRFHTEVAQKYVMGSAAHAHLVCSRRPRSEERS